MSNTLFDIASKMQEALKDKTHLLEGDQLDDDKKEDQEMDDTDVSDGAGDAGGGDVGGDIGGDIGGSDDDGSASIDKDTEESIDQMQDNVEAEQNVPKDLVLNDGTTTNTSVDSGSQEQPLNQDTKDFLFQFGEGNFDEFSESAKEYSQSVTSVIHTFVPLCEKALIELFGNSAFYKRELFDAKTNVNNGTTSIDVNLRYKANTWIGTDIPYAAIQQDKQHIVDTISVVPGITIKQVNIDSNTGNLDISVNIGGIKDTQENPANVQLQQQVVNESREEFYKRICESEDNWQEAVTDNFNLRWEDIKKILIEQGVTDEDDLVLFKSWVWKNYMSDLNDGDEIAFLSEMSNKLELCGCENPVNAAELIYEELDK